jgi:hypothetical protein
MKESVEITKGFTGYPNGKNKRHFAKGESPELSNDYADLLVEKGLGREVPPPTRTGTPAKEKD